MNEVRGRFCPPRGLYKIPALGFATILPLDFEIEHKNDGLVVKRRAQSDRPQPHHPPVTHSRVTPPQLAPSGHLFSPERGRLQYPPSVALLLGLKSAEFAASSSVTKSAGIWNGYSYTLGS